MTYRLEYITKYSVSPEPKGGSLPVSSQFVMSLHRPDPGQERPAACYGRFRWVQSSRVRSAPRSVVAIAQRRPTRWPLTAMAAVVAIVPLTAGCFEERPWPMRPQDRVLASPPTAAERQAMAGSTRKWLVRTHGQLQHLLHERGTAAMLTDQMGVDDGTPRDVYHYFDRDPRTLNKLTKNWYGLLHTAQSASRAPPIEAPIPVWPGFQQVWIPVADDFQLSGWVGFAEQNGRPCKADCIVLVPGFLGDNAVTRTRYLAQSLREAGFHVLALELRGHGHTELRYPDVYYTFGVMETQDLIKVSEWLQDTYPQVAGTGLVGFCWGANLSMLAAWYDGRQPGDPSITESVARFLDPPSARRHYTAGVLAFAPVLRWEELMDNTDHEHTMIVEPPMFFFQQFVRDRMIRKGYPEASGSVRRLIAYEFSHSLFGPSMPVDEAYTFLRFLPYRGLPDGGKLEHVRVPLLMVSTSNDPFLSAQDTADMMARIHNPKVAALILRGGGHIGFAAYNRSYFYGLVATFFDPKVGAAACLGGEN